MFLELDIIYKHYSLTQSLVKEPNCALLVRTPTDLTGHPRKQQIKGNRAQLHIPVNNPSLIVRFFPITVFHHKGLNFDL